MSGPSIAPEALAGLTALAQALCVDRRITVVAADCSVFNAQQNVIGIDVDPASEPARARGLLAHECGHALISRYHLWPVPTFYRSAWFKLLNTLEDPRVDLWMIRRYAGSLPWFDAVADDVQRINPSPPSSLFLQVCLAASAIDHRGRSHLDRRDWLHPEAARVFDATREMRRRYCATTPDPDPGPRASVPEATIRPSVGAASRGEAASAPDPFEESVRASAHAAWRIARDEILPAVLTLIERDIARIVAFAQCDAAADLALAGGSDTARIAAVRAALDHVRPERVDASAVAPDDDIRRKRAMRAFDLFVGSGRRSQAAGERDGGELRRRWIREEILDGEEVRSPRRRGGAPPGREPFVADSERRIRTQIATLCAALEAVMVDRRRARWRSGFRSGRVPDLRRLMRYDADRRDDRVWRRLRRQRAPGGAAGLLVDLSGSMNGGGKIEAAVAGTILFAEAASAAGIDFLIDGFQDELIPIAAIGERCTPAMKRRIEEMALETCNRRPRGNNAAGNNDDGPCLDAFAQKLPMRAGSRNLLIVISDGQPAGLRSTADDLHRSIAQLTGRPDLTLVGLGLGDGTSHVRDFYPIALADVPVERLGAEIGRILETHCRTA